VATPSLTFCLFTVPDSLDFMPISLDFTYFHGATSMYMEHLQILPCLATREGLLPAITTVHGTYILLRVFHRINKFAFKGLWSWYLEFLNLIKTALIVVKQFFFQTKILLQYTWHNSAPQNLEVLDWLYINQIIKKEKYLFYSFYK